MHVSTIPASRLHPVFAQIARITQQAYGMPPTPQPLPLPPHPPEEVRRLLDERKTNSSRPQDKHAALPLGSADAI